MATIDADYIRAVNDRLMWDGIWEDTCRTFNTGIEGRPHPRGVYEALDGACEFLQGQPKLLICSWAVGKKLLDRYQRDWNNTSDGKLPPEYPFHRDLDAEREWMLEKGYLGKYRGAYVVASIYADESNGECGVLATTDVPRDIDYDGSNCIRLQWA